MCFAPQRHALFRHLNVQKCSERGLFCRFWLGNVLRAKTACTFSTSQLPKVVWDWCALYILTLKCASRHNGVHFFDISTSKSAPNVRCFQLFQLQIRFTPQRRALFRSEAEVLCTFWLGNVLPAATFSTSQLLKVLRGWGALYIDLEMCLRTLRFREPTFRPSGATNHWKNTVNRDFPTFSCTCIFFLLTLSLLWSSLFFSFVLWLFPPVLVHLSILSEDWLLNFLRP